MSSLFVHNGFGFECLVFGKKVSMSSTALLVKQYIIKSISVLFGFFIFYAHPKKTKQKKRCLFLEIFSINIKKPFSKNCVATCLRSCFQFFANYFEEKYFKALLWIATYCYLIVFVYTSIVNYITAYYWFECLIFDKKVSVSRTALLVKKNIIKSISVLFGFFIFYAHPKKTKQKKRCLFLEIFSINIKKPFSKNCVATCLRSCFQFFANYFEEKYFKALLWIATHCYLIVSVYTSTVNYITAYYWFECLVFGKKLSVSRTALLVKQFSIQFYSIALHKITRISNGCKQVISSLPNYWFECLIFGKKLSVSRTHLSNYKTPNTCC